MSAEEMERRYRAHICPSCSTPDMQWIPEAPGSDEGKRCVRCLRVWVWWPGSNRPGARIIDQAAEPWWAGLFGGG